MAGARVIHGRIEREAHFGFVDPETCRPRPDEIRFDTHEREYTHEGDSCTLDVMTSGFVPDDPVLAAVTETVHDIDMKEPRFGRHEMDGLRATLVEGIRASE